MEHIFNERAAGSYYQLGSETSHQKIILMHGQGSSAETIRLSAEKLSECSPNAQIIVPNGGYIIPKNLWPEEMIDQVSDDYVPFTWYPQNEDQQRQEDPFNDMISDLKSDLHNRIYMVGFSMGGFRAGDEYLNAPENFAGVVLHSSAIIQAPKKIEKQTPKSKRNDPAKLLTLMGTKDPYLRQKWALALLPIHYKNQWKANRAGIKSKTKFIWGLDHSMSKQSIAASAQHIQAIEDTLS